MKLFKSSFSPFKTKSWFSGLKYYLKVQLRKLLFKVKTHPYLSSFLFLVFTLFFYLFFSLSTVSASRLELLALKQEINNQSICHEDCRYDRQRSRESLAIALKEDVRLLNDIQEYFSLSEVDSSGVELVADKESIPEANQLFLEELIQIILLAYGANNPPNFLIDYLAHPSGDEKIKSIIIRDFLAGMTDPELVDYYYLILNGENGYSLKREALKALSSVINKETSYQVEQLDIILNLIFSGILSPSLNLDLIFLLSEYYELYPIESKQVLISVYDYSVDPVLRAVARDILQQFGDNSLAEIVVTAEDWEKYWR